MRVGLPLPCLSQHVSPSFSTSQDLIPSGTMMQLTLDSQGVGEEPETQLEASSDKDMVGGKVVGDIT